MPQSRSQPTGPRQTTLQAASHRNHGLFSDHYLNDTLPGRVDWRMLSRSAEVAEALAKLQTLFTPFAPHAEGSNAAQTEVSFIKPVLQVRGLD